MKVFPQGPHTRARIPSVRPVQAEVGRAPTALQVRAQAGWQSPISLCIIARGVLQSQ